jgi:N-acetylmuramoyl-L-alanine amidase
MSLCLILFIGGYTPIQIASAASQTITISTSSLNVREGPGLSYRVIEKVSKGQTFTYSKEDGDWIQINLPGSKKGWVANWLITKNASSGSSNHSTLGSQATVLTDGLRIRKGPGTGFQVIGSLNKGQAVDTIDKNENWIKINGSFGEGWVSADFIQSASVSTPSPKKNPSATTKGMATVENLNVRTEPSLNARIVGKLGKGESVSILSFQRDWVKIDYKGASAWVSSQFIQTKVDPPSSSAPQTPAASVIGTVTATALSVRSTGSLNGKILGSVQKGTSFQIIEEVNNWAKIEYKKDSYGWVAGWFLSKSTSKEPTKEQTVKESTVTILYNGTNIRKGPNVQTSVVKRANAGDQFEVLSLSNNWYQIKLADGSKAYVAGWIVSVSGPAPQIEKPGAEKYLKDVTIVLDPGHGGRDGGTEGARGTLEKGVTLRTTTLLYDKLKASGANVILTRNNDTYISLRSRVSTAEYHNADAFISIHYDSINDRCVRGMTAYYYHTYQKQLATSVFSATVAKAKLKDRGVRQGDYHVLRENNQKAVLLELGYLSNPTEEMLINSSQFQESVATGIFQGLAQFFKTN